MSWYQNSDFDKWASRMLSLNDVPMDMDELISSGKLGAVFKSKFLLFHMHTGGRRQVIPHIIRNGSWRIRNRGSRTVFQPCLCFFGGVWSCCIVSVLCVSCYWACFCSLNAPVFWRCFHLCVKSFICYGRPHVFVPCFLLIFPQWAFFSNATTLKLAIAS